MWNESVLESIHGTKSQQQKNQEDPRLKDNLIGTGSLGLSPRVIQDHLKGFLTDPIMFAPAAVSVIDMWGRHGHMSTPLPGG